MKSRWPKLGEVEPPEGAELADEKASQTAKDKRKRPEVKVKFVIKGWIAFLDRSRKAAAQTKTNTTGRLVQL